MVVGGGGGAPATAYSIMNSAHNFNTKYLTVKQHAVIVCIIQQARAAHGPNPNTRPLPTNVYLQAALLSIVPNMSKMPTAFVLQC